MNGIIDRLDAEPEDAVKIAYDAWCLNAEDPLSLLDGNPVPLLTTLIYGICEGDIRKFELVDQMLERAFRAGVAAAGLLHTPPCKEKS